MKPGSRCRHKAVLKLEVPVDDSLGVEELQGGGDVRNDHGSLLLSEEPPPLDVTQELATKHPLALAPGPGS